VKCAVVEPVHRTLRNKLYRYFPYKNKYRYIDILPKFVKAINNTVYTATGMGPAAVTDKHVLEKWTSIKDKRSRFRKGGVKFRMAQHVTDQ